MISGLGKLIYSTEAYRFLEDAGKKPFYEKIRNENSYFTVRMGGREKLFSYAHSKGYKRFKGLNWVLVMAHDIEEILKPSIVLKRRIITVSIGLIALGLCIVFSLSLTITKPINKLVKGTQAIGKGDLKHRVHIKTQDEMGQLAAAFNEMTEKLSKADEELRASESKYRNLAENLDNLIYRADPETFAANYVNRAIHKIYGYSVEEWLNDPTLWEITIHPEDRERVLSEFAEAQKSLTDKVVQYRIIRRDGAVRFVEDGVNWELDEEGKLVSMNGVMRDVTERKQKEEEKRGFAARLEAVNKELEAFTYSVSHDLSAPLRAIDGFSRILLEDHSAHLDGEGKRVLNTIDKNVKKMGHLIDGLLAFSRLDRKSLNVSHINMEKTVQDAIEQLRPLMGEREMRLDVQTLLPAEGDRTLILEVVVNLLSNAIKFTGPVSKAVIEVGCREGGKENTYYVRDNGVGFDMAYHDKMFGVFQRLHSTKEFEGTGIGLALVQRIVHRHGGRVWAEGTVNEGATFYFLVTEKLIAECRLRIADCGMRIAECIQCRLRNADFGITKKEHGKNGRERRS